MLKRSLRPIWTVLLVTGMAMTGTACATYGYGGQRSGGYGGYGRQIERVAYDNGVRDGARAGERDGRSGRPFSYNRHDDWRDADDGYRREYGNYDVYRRTYRSGFENGYSDSYNRYNRYGNSGRYPRDYPNGGYGGNYPTYPSYPGRGGVAVPRGSYSPAGQNGYRDGLEAGRDDARSRRAVDPHRAKRYREGDHDYDNRYGSRDEYKREYRAAFEQGYQDGYGYNRR
jgi:hypothetical protein